MSAKAELMRVRSVCLGYPRAVEKTSHGSPCFFIEKGRQFCAFVDGHHKDKRVCVWLPMPPGWQESYIEEDPATYFKPPYVGPSGWVGAVLESVSDKRLAELVEAAYTHASRER